MSLLQTAAVLGSLAASAYGHGHVTGIVADGTYYVGYDPSYQYMATAPEVVGWSTPEDQGNGFIAPDAYTDPDIICHLGATPGKKAAKVAAGGKVELQWTAWPESHHGPVLDYLAKCAGDDCSTVTKADLEFFKIGASGLIDDTTVPGHWASDDLIANNNTWVANIPSDIAPGQYVLRHEIIALHSAGQADGAQNYPMCVNIEVTGSGTAAPAGTKGTALYKEDAPGIVVNIYAAITDYVMPGPALYSGAATGSTAASSAAPAASSAAASSAPASSAPASSAPAYSAPASSAAASSAPASSAPAYSAPASSAAASSEAPASYAAPSSAAPTTAAAPATTAAPAAGATETTTCVSTITVATSVTASVPVASASVYSEPVNTANAAVSALASALPSSVLTATISTALPAPASYGSSDASGSASAGMPSKALPEGFTLKDLLEWVSYLLGKAIKEGGIHARDFAPRRR